MYYVLQSYWTKKSTFTKWRCALRQLRLQLQETAACKRLLDIFEHNINEVNIENSLFPHRAKRGAFNILGTMANALFAAFDAEYASKVSNTINSVVENKAYLNTLLKNQTSIIKGIKRQPKNLNIIYYLQFDDQVNTFKLVINSLLSLKE